MAAYAAVTSLKYTIDQIQHHPSPPISLDQHQAQSLTQIITFLQKFLEVYISPVADSGEADPLELRIAEAAYAAEDVIESYLVDNIPLVDDLSCVHFHQDLEKAIEEMDLVNREATEKLNAGASSRSPLRSNIVSGNASAGSGEGKSEMVGFDDVLLRLLDRLTGWGRSDRQIIPIVGMGGIGKTTLAQNVFQNALIKEHFDICVWATISQNYNIRETFREVLSQAKGYCSGESESELGEALHKHLAGRRYLVIMDDMWDIEVWDKIRFFFPDYNNGSRVLVTTRLSDLAARLSDSDRLDMAFLDEGSSWTLFSKIVFREECFPLQLEEIGKKIVENCRGLPLSIAVIGGLLAKSEKTQEYWEHVEENLKSILNSENGGDCLRILKMSYNHLPVYLKPCFLYMGWFEEDRAIHVSTIIELWVAEGFLKPVDYKDSETVAREYLKELVDRNLVLVNELGCLGNLKYCKMHDLLRDLALQEAQKQRFYYVMRRYDPQGINGQRRIVVPDSTSDDEVVDALTSMTLARSYFCLDDGVPQLPKSRLMRTLSTYNGSIYNYPHSSIEDVVRLVNSRYIKIGFSVCEMPSSIKLLWNLHTLIFSCRDGLTAPIEFWEMHQLRHVFVYSGVYLPNPPPSNDNDFVILENLQTLKGVEDLNLNDEVVKRIPNIKTLKIRYTEKSKERVMCLRYLHCLSKLENFRCFTEYECHEYLRNITFPNSLKTLSLWASNNSFEVDDILKEIGALPLLHKLKLSNGSFKTGKWEITQGQFERLRLLELFCCDLQEWIVLESSCFPLLRVIGLHGLEKLNEIPSEIGEIPTLKLITMDGCSETAVLSAKKIIEEQENLQGGQLDFEVKLR